MFNKYDAVVLTKHNPFKTDKVFSVKAERDGFLTVEDVISGSIISSAAENFRLASNNEVQDAR